MITKLFVTRPTLATVLVAIATLVGVLAAMQLRVQELPNVDVPEAQIVVFYSAASPSEMRDTIVKPLEDHLAGAPGLDHMTTRIQQGFAFIKLQFGLRTNRTNDLVEVQRRVQDAQSELPADLITPTIQAFDAGHAPVAKLAVTSSVLAPGDLSAQIRDRVAPAIEQLPSVGGVDAKPIIVPAIEVQVDPAKLDADGLAINDVINAIAGNNVHAPGGILNGSATERGISIRGDVNSAASVANLPIPSGAQAFAFPGAPVPAPKVYKVSEVAQVTNGHTPQRIYAYSNGTPVFLLTIQKATNASEVDAAHAVIAALPDLEREFPGLKFSVIDDQSAYTASQVRGVERTLLEGIFLVAIVMIFFLRSWRNALSVLIAIPTSLLVTLVVMRLGDLTIDTVSLLAMTLITGILVDDSIVVLENSQRHRDAGDPPVKAAIEGRLEIGLAAIVITLVDVVVFLPIAFLPGIVGKFLSEFAIVVVVATLSSLAISFTVTPALAANWSLLSLRRGTRFIEGFERGFDRVRTWYSERALPYALRHPILTVGIAFVTFGLAVMLLWPLGIIGFEFIPPQDTGEIFMQLDYPGGTPIATTRNAVRAIEDQVNKFADVRSEVTIAGAAISPVGDYLIDGAVGQIDVHLRPKRAHSTAYWMGQLRDLGNRIAPSAHPVVIPVENIQTGNAQPLDYLVGDSAGDPSKAAHRVYAALLGTPGATNVYSSVSGMAPQLNVAFDRDKARKLSISVGAAAMAIRAAFGGLRATQFETVDGLKDVEVIYPPNYQRSVAQVKGIPVRALDGSIAHVGDFASFSMTQSPRVIDRVDRQTVVHVSANVAPGATLSGVQSAFAKKLAALSLPATVSVMPSTSGDQQNLTDTINGMEIALVLGFALVFLLMVALYNSYLSPFIIMLSVPLAVVGALGLLALTHQTLNAFSLIGTVLLIGLVSKNGILLVDFANRLHAQGIERIAAIREAARTRFRPILMTTVAMVFGMLPLALGLDPAVVARRSLGLVVIGGLTSSLLLTLVVIPVIYVWLVRERPVVVPEAVKRIGAR